MALRAGYYGVKRWLWDKLQTMPNRMDAAENDLDVILNITGSKNLFKSNASTTTDAYGVTWTVDSKDKNIITVSGTPTGYAPLNMTSYFVLPPGDYILTGSEGCTNATFNTIIFQKGTTMVESHTFGGTEYNKPYKFTVSSTWDYDNIRVTLKRINNGTACSGTFKVMIRPAAVEDDTYVPFTMTNLQLTASADDQKAAINAIISAATDAADFEAFKTAMGAITPVTRSAAPAERSLDEEEDEPVVVKKTTRKKTTKTEEED